MNKKGFTLLEIMATIIILGIIALVSIPSANSSIEKSKKRLTKNGATALAKAIENNCHNEELDEVPRTEVYTIDNKKISKDIDAKNLPEKGIVLTDSSCNVELAIVNNGYCVIKEKDKYTLTTNTYNCSLEYTKIPDTPSNCFIFDEESKTITGYKFDDASCPSDIAIPSNINNIPVEHIGELAFASKDYDVILGTNERMLENQNKENPIDDYDIISNLSRNGYSAIYYEPMKIVNSNIKKNCYYNNYNNFDEKPLNYIITNDDKYDACVISPKYNYKTDYTNLTIISGPITSVNFLDAINLKSIGNGAFMYNKITKIIFGNLPNLTDIGVDAFSYNLISGKLDLSGLINLKVLNGDIFFSNNIVEVILSNNLEK